MKLGVARRIARRKTLVSQRGRAVAKAEKKFYHKGHKGHIEKIFGFGSLTAKSAKGAKSEGDWLLFVLAKSSLSPLVCN